MIPKIIHYCWFGGQPLPEDAKRYIESWKKYCPDYFREYIDRSVYIHPEEVLCEPVSMDYLFERYRLGKNSIDYLRFYDEIVTDESYASYENAISTADMDFIDPYEKLKLAKPLDLGRIRNGESKYVIRDLFRMKYPDVAIPLKQPMPRPVDEYFRNWEGPKRPEFRKDIDINKYVKMNGCKISPVIEY